jgi:hypothetical protein
MCIVETGLFSEDTKRTDILRVPQVTKINSNLGNYPDVDILKKLNIIVQKICDYALVNLIFVISLSLACFYILYYIV